ncbi:hypothetical protein [Colwellia polaris]|uniref:hypothetical protein n=1 Tax=Colwellia polaris TaxID=326537 RepID=UPI0011777830|nr:hypothetical protein [Colwellia polaris]
MQNLDLLTQQKQLIENLRKKTCFLDDTLTAKPLLKKQSRIIDNKFVDIDKGIDPYVVFEMTRRNAENPEILRELFSRGNEYLSPEEGLLMYKELMCINNEVDNNKSALLQQAAMNKWLQLSSPLKVQQKQAYKLLKGISTTSQHLILGYQGDIKNDLLSLAKMSDELQCLNSKVHSPFYKAPLMALTVNGLEPYTKEVELIDVVTKPYLTPKYKANVLSVNECIEKISDDLSKLNKSLSNAKKHTQVMRVKSISKKIKYLIEAKHYIDKLPKTGDCFVKQLSQVKSKLHLYYPKDVVNYNTNNKESDPFYYSTFPFPLNKEGYVSPLIKIGGKRHSSVIDWPAKLVTKPINTVKQHKFEDRDIQFVGDLNYLIGHTMGEYFPFCQVNSYVFFSSFRNNFKMKDICPGKYKPFTNLKKLAHPSYENAKTTYRFVNEKAL